MYARSFGGSCAPGHNLQVTKYPGNVLFCSPAQVPGLVPGLHGRRAAPSSAPFSTLTAHVHRGRDGIKEVLYQNGKLHINGVCIKYTSGSTVEPLFFVPWIVQSQ